MFNLAIQQKTNDLEIAAQDNRGAACDLLECLNDLGESGEVILSRFVREINAERNNRGV